MFKAGDVEGTYKVTASVGNIAASAEIIVSKKEKKLFPPKEEAPKDTYKRLSWQGEIQPQKWMNFYTKIFSKFVTSGGLKINLKVEISPPEGVSKQKVDETKGALRELGLDDEIDAE